MELPRRKPEDVFLTDGTFGRTVASLGTTHGAHDLRIGIVYAFDFRTRMLPYWYADKRMAPCAVRTLADALYAGGFRHIRVVLQQWTPNFRPSLAEIDGKPLDILLVSAMQVHAEPSYDLIREVHRMGDDRPLVLAGGPKAIYEPADYFDLGPIPGVGADCVITGEAFVLLAFMEVVLKHRGTGETARKAFDRARSAGALKEIPGLVYLDPECGTDQTVAVNTGVQRLLRDLDEMPLPDAGYRLLEPRHRGKRLRKRPLAPARVRWNSPIASVISTHGCKFNCSYCPIPAVNQRTWRHKSPQRLAEEIKHLRETFGLKSFFSTDDNFFNHRGTVVDQMTALAETQTTMGPLGRNIRFYTEATEFDVHKNQDILPLCRDGGMRGIWFGIEDITAELINKGQTAGKTAELFKVLWGHGIEPMAMMIHSDEQAIRAKRDDLTALLNQVRYLFNSGAISYQCTYLSPAVGTRDFETMVVSRRLFRSVAEKAIPEAFYDGNHVVASQHARPWERQLNVLRAYWGFYNPVNTLRSIMGLGRRKLAHKQLLFQIVGQIGLLMTAPKHWGWARRLKRGPIKVWEGLQPSRVPMIDVHTRRRIDWAIGRPLQDAPVSEPRQPMAAGPPHPDQDLRTMALPVLST